MKIWSSGRRRAWLQAIRNLFKILGGILVLFTSRSVEAQSSANEAMDVSAVAQSDPSLISLSWTASASALGYDVYRKSESETVWGPAVATLDASATAFSDTDVRKGINYEYRVSKKDSHRGAEGFVYSGIQTRLGGSSGTSPVPANNSTDNTWPAWGYGNVENPRGGGGGNGGGGSSGAGAGGGGGGNLGNSGGPPGTTFPSGPDPGDPGFPLTGGHGYGGGGGFGGVPLVPGAVPEPASYAAAASVCACLSLLGLLRKKKRADCSKGLLRFRDK